MNHPPPGGLTLSRGGGFLGDVSGPPGAQRPWEVHLEAVLLLLVHGVRAAESRDELQGGERLLRLLPEPAVGEHALDHPDDVALGEAVSDLGQAAHVQGTRNDPSVALDDLLPQNCVSEMEGKTETTGVTPEKAD